MRYSDLKKFFGLSVVGLGVFAFVGLCYAASNTGRSAYGRVTGATTARMPSMPSLPGMAVGNTSHSVPTVSIEPSVPDEPNEPDMPNEPDTPTSDCPDGGVVNSEYTVENCLDDIQRCVDTGALPGGMNDLFNEGLRNSIKNGVSICIVQVEKCVADVRKDCANVYSSAADVWDDFYSRRVEPEYYNFVLRKTGLTPSQAEYVCRLLDKNTYGTSFAAVSNSGGVTAEYGENVGAYNEQRNGSLDKSIPLGMPLNDGKSGVDGVRGHYARWDAATATCLVRVAAYNKDKQITNSWLFGAIGDEQPAEVWRAAGETFTCNKDLFGFSLMNDTKTAAVVGVGGGTLLGAGVGAAVGGLEDSLRAVLGCVYSEESANSETVLSNCLNEAVKKDSIFQVCVDQNVKSIEECEKLASKKLKLTGGYVAVLVCPDDISDADCIGSLTSYRAQVCQGVTTVTECEQKIENSLGSEPRGISRGSSAAIGAATGATAGGLATAITAFVEKNNIMCRVGDGLDTVAYGKSYSIENLRDFYFKWNLQLPEKF